MPYGQTGIYGSGPYKGQASNKKGIYLLLQLMPQEIGGIVPGIPIYYNVPISNTISGSALNIDSDANYQILKMLLPE